MEELLSSQCMFYSLCRDFSFFVQIRIELDQPVNLEALRRALAPAIARYPYFQVKLIRRGEKLCLVRNHKPFLLYDDVFAPTLEPDKNNDYLLRVSAAGNLLNLCICHALGDGRGIFPLIKTLLHYYWLENFGRAPGIPDVRLAGDGPTEEECQDPYRKLANEKIPPAAPQNMPGTFFHVPQVPDPAGRKYSCRFSTSRDDLMKRVRQAGGSPNAWIAQLLSEVIAAEHPERKEDIGAGVIMDLRPALQVKTSHHCLVSMIPLSYEAGLAQPEKQRTAWYRQQILRGSTLSERQKHTESSRQFSHLLKTLPTMQERITTSRTALNRGSSYVSFTVSYIGQEDLGEANEHIRFLDVLSDVQVPTISTAIISFGPRFFFNLNQNFADERYALGLLRRLTAAGISCADYQRIVVPPVPFIDLEKL